MSANNELQGLITKLQILLDDKAEEKKKSAELTDEEKETLKAVLKLVVAFRRLGNLGVYLLLGLGAILINFETVIQWLTRVFGKQ